MGDENRTSRLADFAVAIERALPLYDREKLFESVAEAGYLVALADTDVDSAERKVIDEALFALSKEMVIDWEVDGLIHRACERIGAEGHVARAKALGEHFKALGQVGVGMYVAALVALATHGLDKREVATLRRIGSAAGLDDAAVANIVKRARDALA
jgi:tellurite resistance protein